MDDALQIWMELLNDDELIDDFSFNNKIQHEGYNRDLDSLNLIYIHKFLQYRLM
jgi:hypothetical protein